MGLHALAVGGETIFSGCSVGNAAASLTSGTTFDFTFSGENYDTDGYHSLSVETGRLTVPVSGYYEVEGHVDFASNATGRRGVFISKNELPSVGNFVTVNHAPVNGTATRIQVLRVVYLVAGDWVRMGAIQTSGGALDATPTFAIARRGS